MGRGVGTTCAPFAGIVQVSLPAGLEPIALDAGGSAPAGPVNTGGEHDATCAVLGPSPSPSQGTVYCWGSGSLGAFADPVYAAPGSVSALD